MDRLRHPVMKLRRVSYGPFKLGTLKTGEMRKLEDREYRMIRERILRKKVEAND
jgi:16S rRNA U516 pseudouridylate synthase RsuA-like enzyme